MFKDKFNLEQFLPKYNFGFGMLVVIGGFIGFFVSKSIPSLVAGLVFGNLLMLTIWGVTPKEQKVINYWGYYAAALLSIALLIFFIIRLIKTGKPFPAAVIIPCAFAGVLLNSFMLHKKSLSAPL
jgi:uncharacterized membrane protein (UPF0136 family)